MRLPALLCFALLSSACLENEEAITVRENGSIGVQITARGDAADLCTGYAVPFDGRWTPRNQEALDWLEHVAPDTGGPQARARQVELGEAPNDEDRTLVVEAEFASADELPRWFAPEGEPYRSAYLARSASLTMRQRGRRTVYTFERTFHGRRYAPWDVVERARHVLPPELMDELESGFQFSDEQWPDVAAALEDAYVAAGAAFVRSALSSLYTEGDASLSPTVVRRALDELDVRLRRVGSQRAIGHVHELVRELRQADDDGRDKSLIEQRLTERVAALESEGRRAMRDTLASVLADEEAPLELQNAVRARLEWAFTSYDHTGDLSDERFTVRVRMPGVVLDGNFDELDGEVALWRFEGDELKDHDRVLHVVSVR